MGSAVVHKRQILHNHKNEIKYRTVSFWNVMIVASLKASKTSIAWYIISVFPVSHNKEVHGNIVLYIKEDKN